MGRRGVPQDMADLVRFLVGPYSRFITGQTIHVNGGAHYY
jgi:3-oxoacyl-[acyl-carrier protein] reductase